MENIVLTGFLLAAVSLVCIAAWAVFGKRRKEGVAKRAPAPESLLDAIEGEDDEEPVEVRLERLERSLRMLIGRVNKLSPPREGTGKPNGKESPPVQEGLGDRPMSRAELYARALKRR